MKDIEITNNEAGMKLQKFCMHVLKEAPASFFYKMYRKKNIVVNKKKVTGNETLQVGDHVQFFLSDETFSKFSGDDGVTLEGKKNETSSPVKFMSGTDFEKNFKSQNIIYENQHILIYNKPAGLLSQKARPEDISVNEVLLQYMLNKGYINGASLKLFKPSVCNRLDRNTSGVILFGKTQSGSAYLSKEIREGKLEKIYLAAVVGDFKKDGSYHHYILKDSKSNQSEVISEDEFKKIPDSLKASYKPIFTEYKKIDRLVLQNEDEKNCYASLLQVVLHTGKSHQIRADLKYLGNPILHDPKYGRKDNEVLLLERRAKASYQMLHAWKVVLSGKEYKAAAPSSFGRLFNNY